MRRVLGMGVAGIGVLHAFLSVIRSVLTLMQYLRFNELTVRGPSAEFTLGLFTNVASSWLVSIALVLIGLALMAPHTPAGQRSAPPWGS